MIHSPLFEGFLEGVIATSSLAAGAFFLRFWRDTRDSLFLAFSLAFLIEGVNRCVRIFFTSPNEASPWVFVVRAFAFLIILAGIVGKNRSRV
ncbi:MAG TPA: DUF5985 family protein [Acidobacteriaceae bacterium]|jgi:uncharacterized membrane protein HdeD (DUF308 family)|nr:DUF5985 family protein [Acidobacteriaceae bacterium]